MTIPVEDTVDALPEHTIYRDRGCEAYPACLECPAPRCLEETPRARQKMLLSSRAVRAQEMSEAGMDSVQIARALGISRRTVQRTLQQARAER